MHNINPGKFLFGSFGFTLSLFASLAVASVIGLNELITYSTISLNFTRQPSYGSSRPGC